MKFSNVLAMVLIVFPAIVYGGFPNVFRRFLVSAPSPIEQRAVTLYNERMGTECRLINAVAQAVRENLNPGTKYRVHLRLSGLPAGIRSVKFDVIENPRGQFASTGRIEYLV